MQFSNQSGETNMSKINPFGQPEQTVKPATEVLTQNFGIGIRNYDRGADVWDANKTDEQGNVKPGWTHQADESLECVIEFSVNEGKGTGRQAIPANEFTDYVDALQAIIDGGYEEPAGPDRTEYVPTPTVAASSFKMVRPRIKGPDGKTTMDKTADRNVVSVRCTGGKGSKPMLIQREEFPQVVTMLRGIADSLSDYSDRAWAQYEEEQAAAAADASTSSDD
jgi:hypothetical protein